MKTLCNIVFLVLLGHWVLAAPKNKHHNSSLPVENLKVMPYSGATPEDLGDGTSEGPVVPGGMFTLNRLNSASLKNIKVYRQWPGIWPPPLPTRPPHHTPRPTPRPTTEQPTGSSDVYSRCGVKGPNTRTFSVRANNNNISEGESKPFIEDKTWSNPPRNDSDHAETLRKLKNKILEEDPLAALSQVRISFGNDTGPREYPWQVAMKVRGRFECGASIIGDQYILTAAHCVFKYQRSPTSLKLSLGDYDLSTSHEQPNYVPTVERVTVHPAYLRSTLRNDIAVLKLTKKIKFSSTIRPVCLAPAGFEPTGKIAIVTGWGRDENYRLQAKLKELASEVTTNNYCAGQWEKSGAPRGFITKDMMCMSPIGGDSCLGDSGGPSVMEIGGTHYQIGIVSFGSGSCVDETLPGVYTRVTSFRDWIMQQMN